MRMAVVGGGVSGLTCAYLLSAKYDVTLFEASPQLGGHTHTVGVQTETGTVPVDMGFIVFNEENYPGFVALLDALGVDSQPSDMSFGVRSERTGVEFKATSVDTLFAQRRNLVNPSFYRLLWDIDRFRRRARQWLATSNGDSPSLHDYLREGGYSRRFIDEFIIPMSAAIWSANPQTLDTFPARTLLQFFDNHRFLESERQPQWRTVKGGSRSYVDRIEALLSERVRLRSPVKEVRRRDTHVEVATETDAERFDHVFLCAHSDQTLRMLKEPSREERDVLGAIPYQANDTVLHTDRAVMPRERRAWASWNVFVPTGGASAVNVTYHSNRLQAITHRDDFLVTLNRTRDIQPERVIERVAFDHPVFTLNGVRAQSRRDTLNGKNRTSFGGAYWGYGFHEDGVQSALSAVRPFGVGL